MMLSLLLSFFLIFVGCLSSSNPRFIGSPSSAAHTLRQLSNQTNTTGGVGKRAVAYFADWDIYNRSYNAQDLPADKLTHVLFAFANVRNESGEVFLKDTWSDTDKHYPSDSWKDTGTNVYGCMKQLYLLKKKNRHLKVQLSIGGFSWSSNFAQPASTKEGRATFAKSAVKLVQDLGLDGLDIDWEYPKDDKEAGNMVDLLEATRNELSASHQGKNMLLSVACPAGAKNYEKMHIQAMDKYLDFWNLMAYDYSGSWDSIAAHQANLYPSKSDLKSTPFATSTAVEYYISHGVSPSKLVLGMPLYGRSFLATDGPGQPFNGTDKGSFEKGVWDFKALPQAGAKVMLDDKIGASWSYDAGKRVMISYDTKEVSKIKVDYIQRNGLGGAMWWESSGDKAGDEGIISTVVHGLHDMDRSQNTLDYPDSKYDNIRQGLPKE